MSLRLAWATESNRMHTVYIHMHIYIYVIFVCLSAIYVYMSTYLVKKRNFIVKEIIHVTI